jgi:hypothetical protein
MITTIALSFHYTITLEDTKYMTILTRQEKERLVLDLYNQGKTYRQISKEARIFPRDIGIILNKIMEKKKTEATKEQQKEDAENDQEQPLSLSTQAYKLFSEDKLIGTLANCNFCKASDNWLGKYSPIPQIRNGKLWLS